MDPLLKLLCPYLRDRFESFFPLSYVVFQRKERTKTALRIKNINSRYVEPEIEAPTPRDEISCQSSGGPNTETSLRQ